MSHATIRTDFHGNWEKDPEMAVQFYAMLLLSRGRLAEARELLDWFENNRAAPLVRKELMYDDPSRN